MKRIPQRELRNDSGRILQEVSEGAIVEVTSNGKVMAIMTPPRVSYYELMLQGGRAVAPKAYLDLRAVDRAHVALRTADVLDDLRGDT